MFGSLSCRQVRLNLYLSWRILSSVDHGQGRDRVVVAGCGMTRSWGYGLIRAGGGGGVGFGTRVGVGIRSRIVFMARNRIGIRIVAELKAS